MEQFEQTYMEEQILLLLDNELDAVQAGKVWAQIEAFPEYKALYEEYASVYLTKEEATNIPLIDFSYLQKGSEYELPPMPIKRSFNFKPAWGIAAGVALILAAGLLLRNNNEVAQMDSGLVKSDKIHQTVQAPIQQLAIDSLERKPGNRKTPQQHKSRLGHQKSREQELRLALQEHTAAPGTRAALASIYEEAMSGIALVESNVIQEVPARNNNYYVSLPKQPKPGEDLKLETSNGLLPEMIKAGQWIFGDHKNNTTVEIAIGNNEKRSIKFKL